MRERASVWALALASLGAATLALFAVRSQLGEAHVALVFLLVVLGASAAGGRPLGITTAFVAFLAFDWFFLPPYNTLLVRNPFDWLVLFVFLITSIVAAQLLYRARSERAAVERAESLREADKLKDALLASLSHDLRTPLTTIKALAHELQPLGDERTFIIEEQADRLNRLVTDLLEVARLEGGALPLDIQINAADDLLGAVVQQLSGRPDHDRLKVSLDDPATLSFGRFDFVHSLRILGNLVDNAFKHAPQDTPIEVTGGVDGDALIFRVLDRGNGIATAERDGAFTPFYRSPMRPSGAQSGGLGLSIARRLAEAQGGTLTYTDRAGGGAIFELRLPAATPWR
ncbi:MAG: PAS domain-containing sensor histidine kinase [Gemmatimonadota bacterium]|nr:PAS domain-containing sensor histidine kinase [Gemmatimonadota bacterium]